MSQKESKEKKMQKEAEEVTHFFLRLVLKGIQYVLNVIFTVLLIGMIAGCIVGCAFLIYVSNHVDSSIDDIVVLSAQQNSTTRLYYYENGELVEAEDERLAGSANRLWVAYEDIPDDLINAFVAIEDKRFWEHDGVDWITTIKATLKYFIPTGENPGGSTITQQLVKNVTGDDDYTIQRKVQEIFKALNLEKDKDKTEILENYLNTIYLSQGCYGVQAAANEYFDKDASELTLLECAAIAGITQFPTKWDPVQNPDNNKERRNVILKEMYNQGLITYAEYESAYNKELVLAGEDEEEEGGTTSDGVTSWYTDAVVEEAAALLMEKYGVNNQLAVQMLYSGGYSVVTAMDKEVQDIMEKHFENPNLLYNPNKVVKKQAAMLIMDHTNGNVLALCGGLGEKTGVRILNRATQTKRQPGSSIKPIAGYVQAMDSGIIHYGSVRDDTPYYFGTKTTQADGSVKYSNPKGWPQNSNYVYKGLATIDYALQSSKNTIAVKLVDEVGINNCFNFMTQKLRMTSLIDRISTSNGIQTDKNLAALGLGGLTYGITVREMVAAYCIFPSGGIYHAPRTVLQILDPSGQVVIDNENEAEVVIKESTAQTMVRLLEHVITGPDATAPSNKQVADLVGAAGKTGTTNNNYDRWFIGFTPYMTGGVWVGYDESQDLGIVDDHNVVWQKVMLEAHQRIVERVEEGKQTKKTFHDDLLIEAKYCPDSGKLITDACKADRRGSRSAVGYFTKETLPTEPCDVHVWVGWCTTGRGIAHAGCPESDVRYYGMLEHMRIFDCDVYVTDGQYTWMPLNGTKPYRSVYQPFYRNLLPSGKYPGRTATSRQFNCYCMTH